MVSSRCLRRLRNSSVTRGTPLIARAHTIASHLVSSSPRQGRLASVSFGRNTDRLSKRHGATAKTNLKCLLTKQSELAALPPAHEKTGALFHRLLLSMAIIFRSCCTAAAFRRRPRLPSTDGRHARRPTDSPATLRDRDERRVNLERMSRALFSLASSQSSGLIAFIERPSPKRLGY